LLLFNHNKSKLITFKRIDYINYISKFDHLHEISKEKTKKTGAYKSYVEALAEYLADFLHRAKPLIDTDYELACVDKV
jgi:splicing factor 3A subunit 3